MQPAQADKTNSEKHLTERTMKCWTMIHLPQTGTTGHYF